MTALYRTAAPIFGAALIAAAGAAAAQDVARVDQGADIAPFCGSEPIRIAHLDGYGSDSWRITAHAELIDEAAKCANITEIRYADANGDPSKYSSDINGFVAQGFDIIIAFTDFGNAQLRTYRSATQAGVTMAPYFTDLEGEPGRNFSSNIYEDAFYTGREFGLWTGRALGGEGTTVMLGGPAGAASSATFMDGFKAGLAEHPGVELLDDTYIATNWNPADAQKAVAGLIAKYDSIDAIVTDYGGTSMAAVKAFRNAGLPVPAMATIATTNEYDCMYMEAKEAGDPWQYLAYGGTTADIRFALRHALAAHNGIDTDEPVGVVPYVYADSLQDIDPKCEPDLPPDAQLSSLLGPEKLLELFPN
ncbi:substrate-binding domain-containing protein [Mangrovicoccus ximenensis]|uniref:substrate-binding domain-containing protein n=1 Tax=Mangrovicoccus ximenensis TaxID=1911570 RepID=UPI000D3840E8|nr:substrate-binding domain-containing protein [Mangrovicoccus ximenensis]